MQDLSDKDNFNAKPCVQYSRIAVFLANLCEGIENKDHLPRVEAWKRLKQTVSNEIKRFISCCEGIIDGNLRSGKFNESELYEHGNPL